MKAFPRTGILATLFAITICYTTLPAFSASEPAPSPDDALGTALEASKTLRAFSNDEELKNLIEGLRKRYEKQFRQHEGLETASLQPALHLLV